MSFVHLHCHSEYSLLDGANRIGDLIKRAKHFEQPALALTDHGCMFGAWVFQEQAKKAGLKPIIGMEAYVAPNSRHEKTKAKGEKGYYHLVLLARDYQGYKNLSKLTSLGYTEGFYGKPRIDREVLAKYSEGLIVTSACLAGEIAQHLMDDRWEQAREAVAWHQEVFRDNYYLEVQGHDSQGQEDLNRRIFQLAGEMSVPIVATNDTHFLRAEDHQAHDVLLCIGLGKDFSDPNRMKYDRQLYFKNSDEMAERFPGRPDVLENTLRIADECNWSYPKGYHVPAFPVQEEGYVTENEMLSAWVWKGAVKHYAPRGTPADTDPKTVLPQEIIERVEYELGVITSLNYSGYFLITADFIRWARDHDIPVGPGRGSAAGSIVAYCMGITDCCPIKFDLLFERFLNPERVSMPDVDVDFCFERRGEVIEYVREKYGRDAVGQIITFGTMKSRAVVKDVGRTLGFSPAETDKLAKLIPNAPGFSMTVADAREKIAEIRELDEREPRYRQLLDYSSTLEGLSRHSSVHAAGVVIAPGPLDEYVPICTQSTKGSGGNGESIIVTQYDMTCLEKAGMLKMDFLGLKTLTVIYDTVADIRRRYGALKHPKTGEVYDRAEDIPLDDPEPYAMMARGGTAGVFQFESTLATEKIRQMKADRFDDLIAANALLRPGPLDMGMDMVFIRRKLGQEEVKYPFPELETVLEPTQGVIVYQEQVMRIVQILGGLSLAEADVLRKAVGKKDAELIAKELGKFIDKAVEKGYPRQQIKDLSDQIEAFGRYGFNKSHSAAYSLVAYQTAWLKCYYPAEFMAALMSSVVDKIDDVVSYIAQCREMGRFLPRVGREGIEVLPPHVNESNWKFTVVGEGVGQVRFGLGAIRGVGEGAVRSIIAARITEGPFKSMYDMLSRVDLRLCNKRVLEALICAGALDEFDDGGGRNQLLAGLDAAFERANERKQKEEKGILGFWDETPAEEPASSLSAPTLPKVEKWTETERLAREKEILGFFISGHPLNRYREDVALYEARTNTQTLKTQKDAKIELACVVTEAARQISKKDGSEWGRITVEDFHGTATVLAFGESWAKYKDVLKQDAPVVIRGAVSNRDRDEEDPPVFLDGAIALGDIRNGGDVGVQIEIGSDGPSPEALQSAQRILAEHEGPGALVVVWRNGGTEQTKLKSKTVKVAPRDELLMALRDVLGPERVSLHRDERPLVIVQREERFPRRGGGGGGGGGGGFSIHSGGE